MTTCMHAWAIEQSESISTCIFTKLSPYRFQFYFTLRWLRGPKTWLLKVEVSYWVGSGKSCVCTTFYISHHPTQYPPTYPLLSLSTAIDYSLSQCKSFACKWQRWLQYMYMSKILWELNCIRLILQQSLIVKPLTASDATLHSIYYKPRPALQVGSLFPDRIG